MNRCVLACVCVLVFVCVRCSFMCLYFLTGPQPSWLRPSRHWPSCWVGGIWCCPSRGSVISGRRWCLLGWPPDNTDTHWTVWQVGDKHLTFRSFKCVCLSVESHFCVSLCCINVNISLEDVNVIPYFLFTVN